ncbi:MAG TPA: sugar-transfer associated ATP-grasp domain-containing protein [Gemmatimonadaceae bacterium]|nr:sugar-transfer associated ATP-grasp domain-containing protein [Gemmatimonadaceae bacterium]
MTDGGVATDVPPSIELPLPPRDGRAREPWTVRALLRRAFGPQLFAAARATWRLASWKELRLPYPLSFTLRAWARGFKVENAVLYDLDRVDAGEYVSDYARLYRCVHINPIPELFDQKLLLRRVLADHGFVQPETVALITRYGVLDDPLGPTVRQSTRRQLQDRLIAERGAYIVKPQNGTYGRGIARLEVREGRLVARRGRTVRPYDIVTDAPPDTLIERVVQQHEFWHGLSPSSVNTLRILTLWTPGDPAPFVARAVQRIGTEEGLPTDNWDTGGLLASVDLATGRLGAGRVHRFRSSRADRPYSHHPDTGAPIEGATLPFWPRILETTLAAARTLPLAYYIGWDIAVNATGEPVFIEGNRNTGVRALQLTRGLLADPPTRRFFEACGVV